MLYVQNNSVKQTAVQHAVIAGAVTNPGADDLDWEINRLGQKIDAGAQFFQTQAVYDPATYEKFANAVAKYNLPFLPSIILLKSGDMARFLNDKVPGITVPDAIIEKMDNAATPEEKSAQSIEIAAKTIRELKPMCQGVHLIAAGWESKLPQVIKLATS